MTLKRSTAKGRRRLAGLTSSMDDRESSNSKAEQPTSLDWLTSACLLGPLALFAELLIEKTHHRPLGAATYASFAVLAWLMTGLLIRGLVRRQKGSGTSAGTTSGAEQKSGGLRWVWALALLASLAVFVRVLL